MSRKIELENVQHVLVTGRPGIGKTTLVIKVCELLANIKLPINGFYTKEVRSGYSRIGFDILTLGGKQGSVARIYSAHNGPRAGFPKVGSYIVNVQSFETFALPSIVNEDKSILIIDEIGKMELFSIPFQRRVCEIFQNNKSIVLATVPNTGRPIQFVENLKNLPTSVLIEVNYDNRNTLPEFIASSLNATYTCRKKQ